MKLNRENLLRKSNYGLDIYANILNEIYGPGHLLKLSGQKCEPAKNPLNKDKQTLLIFQDGDVFKYHDTAKPELNGDALDFAKKLLKKEGQPLWLELNNRLNLHLEPEVGEGFNFELQDCYEIPEKAFSLFESPVRNVIPKKIMTLAEAYHLIKGDTYKSRTAELRALTDSTQRRKFKANRFDYVTFSGVFKKRSNDQLVQHSGLLTIDFDHVSNMEDLKGKLLDDEYFETQLLFVSPSGDGLKWVIETNLQKHSHSQFFKAVHAYIKHTYGVEIDQSGKDVSRACFLPHDPEIIINNKILKNGEENI